MQKSLSKRQILLTLLWAAFGFATLVAIIFTLSSLSTPRLVCKSSQGNISITYDDSSITGYSASKLTYDFASQQAYAEQVGVDQYLNEFSDWFAGHTDGSCRR